MIIFFSHTKRKNVDMRNCNSWCTEYCSRLQLLLLVISCFLLAACGGGSDSPVPQVIDTADQGESSSPGATESETPSNGPSTDVPAGDLPGGPFFIAENNSALLSGEVLELPAEASDQDFRRSVPFNVESSDPRLRVLSVQAVSRILDPGFRSLSDVQFVLAAQNISNEHLCGIWVEFSSLSFTDGYIERYEPDSQTTFTIGSNAYNGGDEIFLDSFTFNCLAPGEAGYSIAQALGVGVQSASGEEYALSEVAEVAIAEISPNFDGPLRLTEESVVPLDYSSAAAFSDSTSDRFAVRIVNQSAIDLEVSARLALLDDTGALTFWGFLRFCVGGSERIMTPGEEALLCLADVPVGWTYVRPILFFSPSD